MGKSEAAKIFKQKGCPVFDADAEAFRLLSEDPGAIAEVESLFPDAVAGGTVDRQRLAEYVFTDPVALLSLEATLHPKIQATAMAFLDEQKAKRAAVVVLEMPLLFETDSQTVCTAVAVVSAPEDVQEKRVLARPGMTAQRLEAIRARQISAADKIARADFVIDTTTGKPDTVRQIEEILATLQGHSR